MVGDCVNTGMYYFFTLAELLNMSNIVKHLRIGTVVLIVLTSPDQFLFIQKMYLFLFTKQAI
jgi:hypothetical protein